MSNRCDYYVQQNGNGGRKVERERRRHGQECMHARRIVCACNHTHAKSSKCCKKGLTERFKMMMMVYCVCNLCELLVYCVCNLCLLSVCMPWHARVFVCKTYLDQINALLKIQTIFTKHKHTVTHTHKHQDKRNLNTRIHCGRLTHISTKERRRGRERERVVHSLFMDILAEQRETTQRKRVRDGERP